MGSDAVMRIRGVCFVAWQCCGLGPANGTGDG